MESTLDWPACDGLNRGHVCSCVPSAGCVELWAADVAWSCGTDLSLGYLVGGGLIAEGDKELFDLRKLDDLVLDGVW